MYCPENVSPVGVGIFSSTNLSTSQPDPFPQQSPLRLIAPSTNPLINLIDLIQVAQLGAGPAAAAADQALAMAATKAAGATQREALAASKAATEAHLASTMLQPPRNGAFKERGRGGGGRRERGGASCSFDWLVLMLVLV